MTDGPDSPHSGKLPVPVLLESAETLAAYQRTLRVYNDAQFAEMYFKKWKAHLPRPELEAFAQRISPTDLVLDAGCGPGHHTQYLYELGLNAVGLDLSFESLRLGSANYQNLCFLRSDMIQAPFADGIFSGIWACASSIHLPIHLFQPMLTEFHRLLKSNGVLALTLTVGQEAHFDTLGRFFQASPSPNKLAEQLTATGFVVDTWGSRRISNTTEGGDQTADWGTLMAHRAST